MGTGVYFPVGGGEWPEPDVSQSTPSSADIKNEWSSTSAPPL